MGKDRGLLNPISTGGHHEFNGEIAELLVWDRALTEAELASVWQHLGSKYGVVDQGRPRQPLTVAAARQQALVQVCRVILNLNEFVYSD